MLDLEPSNQHIIMEGNKSGIAVSVLGLCEKYEELELSINRVKHQTTKTYLNLDLKVKQYSLFILLHLQ